MRRISYESPAMDPIATPTSTPAAEPQPSKTQLKRESHALQALGAELAVLAPAQLVDFALPEAVRDAIDELRRTRSHEGRRRQLQYVGRLMRGVDAAPIREALAQLKLPAAKQTLALHRIERWRDDLIAHDTALERFSAEVAGADAQRLRGLVAAARRDAASASARHARSYRELFKFLKESLPDEPT